MPNAPDDMNLYLPHITPAEKSILERGAKKAGLSLRLYAKQALLEWSREKLKKVNKVNNR